MDGTIGVILSGGQSRRMGRDKAGVMLTGRTLLNRKIGRASCRERV